MEAIAITVLVLTGLAFLALWLYIPFAFVASFVEGAENKEHWLTAAGIALMFALMWTVTPINLLYGEPAPGKPLPPMWFVYASLASGFLPVLAGIVAGYFSRPRRKRCCLWRHC